MKQDPTDKIMFITEPDAVMLEVSEILTRLGYRSIITVISGIYQDVCKIFKGEFGGFRASNTPYHDFDHTAGVFLTSARLIHGAKLTGKGLSETETMRALIAAMFHDTGYLQTAEDTDGTGAKYGSQHEARSVTFVRNYLTGKKMPETAVSDCVTMIACTKLSVTPAMLKFRSPGIAQAANIVATADLLAQIADRLYLEKLLLLYKESVDSGAPMFKSERDLLEKTEYFYYAIAKKRIEHDLGNVANTLRLHFKDRWDIDRDLYHDNIKKNMGYLKQIIIESGDHYRDHLKRGNIVKEMKGSK
ncbi:MAG: HD domain-containing protein [Spirochaetes bacterium]|nr:HD domain-containing protein [Spirochaetota bacterium]